MKRLCLLVFASFFLMPSWGQSKVIYEEFSSYKLGETRRLKIQLPRDYETNTEKSYPIVLVFDANYLFEPVAGNVDYFGYWEDMPEALVVGIMQGMIAMTIVITTIPTSCPQTAGLIFLNSSGWNSFHLLMRILERPNSLLPWVMILQRVTSIITSLKILHCLTVTLP